MPKTNALNDEITQEARFHFNSHEDLRRKLSYCYNYYFKRRVLRCKSSVGYYESYWGKQGEGGDFFPGISEDKDTVSSFTALNNHAQLNSLL